MKKTLQKLLLSSLLVSLASLVSAGGKMSVSDDAEVYILSPKNGETVSGPVIVRMGHKGFNIQAAGDAMHNSGHHVLLVDVPMPNLDEDIPYDNQHIHLADGATEIKLYLPPGPHKLQLILVDHNHAVHETPVTSELPVSFTVAN